MKQVLQSKISTAVMAIIIVSLLASIWRILPSALDAYERIRISQAKISKQQKDLDTLKAMQNDLHSDAFLESQTKLKLNYKRPDENVISIADTDSSASNAKVESQQQETSSGFMAICIAILEKIFLKR